MLRNSYIASLIAVASLCCATPHVVTAQRTIECRVFTVADGVPGSVVRGHDVSESGVLWVSGRSGLAFYDGYEFHRVGFGGETINDITSIRSVGTKGVIGLSQDYQPFYYDISQDSFRRLLPDGLRPHCHNIYATPKGNIWLTAGDSLFVTSRTELNDGALLRLFTLADGRKAGNYHKVDADSQGREWLFADAGVVSASSRALVSGVTYDHIAEHAGKLFFVGRRGELGEYDEAHRVAVSRQCQPLADEVRTTLTNAQGTLYAGGIRKLWRIDLRKENSQWEPVADGTFYTLRQDSRGRLWAVGEGESLVMVTPLGDIIPMNVEPKNYGISATRQPVWMEDRDGTVWTATRGGRMAYHDEKTGRMVSPRQPSVDITYWAPGPDGTSLWTSGSLGVFELRMSKTRMNIVNLPSHADIRSLLLTSDGSAWVGLMDGHLLHISPKGKTLSDHTISHCGIYCLAQDSARGRLLVGTKGDGLLALPLKGGAPRHIAQGIGRNIYDIVLREDGAIGVATLDSGFTLLRDGQPPLAYRTPLLRVRRAEHIGQDTWLLSTKEGLYATSGKGSLRRIDIRGQRIADILQTSAAADSVSLIENGGHVWRIALADILSGEAEVDGARLVERADFGEQVQSIATDGCGRTWLVGETKAGCLSPELDGGIFAPQDGARRLQYTEARPAARADRVAIGGKGFALFLHTADLEVSDYQPTPMMTEMLLGGTDTRAVLLGRDTIVLPPETRNFSLSFTALDPAGQDKILYAYCLSRQGETATCMPTATTRRASLLSLGAGTHLFTVRCTNADGLWSPNETTLTIIARPHFYEKASFMALMCLLALMAAAGIVRLAWLHAKRRRTAQENARRLAFLTDISHRLRTPLSLIGGPLGQVLEREELTPTGRTYLQFAYDSSQQMLDLLDSRMQDEGENTLTTETTATPTSPQTTDSSPDGDNADSRLTLLVVEDNEKLRFFLQTSLSPEYRVLTAPNGRLGLETARKTTPDFIITDISMPEMDGMQMVRHLKQDSALSHIPIIILSAKTDISHRIEGLDAGVDDYITKPFSVAYLKSRVDNIVRQREALQSRISYSMTHPEARQPADMPQVSAADNAFLASLKDFLEQNYHNSELRIEDLASAMHLGRTVFFSKVKSITGMAPVDLLRSVRLSHAADLLRRTEQTVAEVAYATGFSDPKYFARSFKEFAGSTPTDYRKTKPNNQQD